MGRYKKYEHLPWWLNSLDDNTLTPTQKEVLDLDYYCKRYGTRLSHQRAADMLDRSRQRVYESRRRLGELCLRTTESSKGSYLLGHPIEYQSETEWLSVLRARGVDPRRLKNKRRSVLKKKLLRASSSSQVSVASDSEAAEARDLHSQAPRGLTNRCSGRAEESAAAPEFRDKCLWEVIYRDALRRNLEKGESPDKAELYARTTANHKVAKRKAERKIK